MKIKVFVGHDICTTITYLKADGELKFNADGKSGTIHTPSGSILNFVVVEN